MDTVRSSDPFTSTVSRVAGLNVESSRPHRRNSAIASTAASYSDAATTSTACSIPSESTNDTRRERAGTITSVGEEKRNKNRDDLTLLALTGNPHTVWWADCIRGWRRFL